MNALRLVAGSGPSSGMARLLRPRSIAVIGGEVAALSRLGAGGAVCYASGFLEAPDGGRLQRDLVDAAASMPIIGPNCYGFINFLDGTPLWPDQHGGRRLDPAERWSSCWRTVLPCCCR